VKKSAVTNGDQRAADLGKVGRLGKDPPGPTYLPDSLPTPNPARKRKKDFTIEGSALQGEIPITKRLPGRESGLVALSKGSTQYEDFFT